MLVLFTPQFLSQNTFYGLAKGTPKIFNLFMITTIMSLSILNPTISDPNLFEPTAFLWLLKELIKLLLTNNSIPECERLVMKFPPWSAPTKHPTYNGLLKGSGIWWGSSSSASLQNSFQSALRPKTDSSTFGTLGSITNILFGFFDRNWYIRYSDSKWTSRGDAW